MLRKVTYCGSQASSFVQATKDLKALAETKLSRERVQRWTKRIGEECVARDEVLAAAYQSLPLPARYQNSTDPIPPVACVMMDGGRIQVRDRREATGSNQGYWKESLVGCCLSMVSPEHAEDPSPRLPKTFANPQRMQDLARGIKDLSVANEAAEAADEEPPDERLGRPEVLVRSVVATRGGPEALGPRLVAEAHARGFHAARRKAFVADGSATNWGVHRKHFSHYTPILDFTHAICYVYGAALAGRGGTAGWRDYLQWAQWLWEGSIDQLIGAVAARSEALGPPSAEDETSPAATVAKTVGYLQNQRARMQYQQYRRQGLPITSSHIESTIKQINRRVKGTEKFWNQGAEPLLALAAAHLTETNRLDLFWRNRPNQLKPTRQYQAAA
jgi:hypothetical protein